MISSVVTLLQRVRNLERRFDFSAPSVLTAGVDLHRASVSCARFYSMQYATPILELKPLNCCDLGFFGQTLKFIQAC